VGALAINLISSQGSVSHQWPLIAWQMYGYQGPKPAVVRYRRFLTYQATGQVAATDFGPIGFLGKAYRIDAGLRRRRTALLATVLRELREDDAGIIGLGVEHRTWRYDETTLDEHLEREPPTMTFRAVAIRPPSPELRASLQGSHLRNGDFESWDGRNAPAPNHWKADGRWLGVGVSDFDTWQRAALLAAEPRLVKRQALRQQVSISCAEGEWPDALHATALVRADGSGVSLQLQVARGASRPSRVEAQAIGDAQWHRLDVTQGVPAGAGQRLAVTVVLTSTGTSDAYFDDVALFTGTPCDRARDLLSQAGLTRAVVSLPRARRRSAGHG
jgi:hypothetical protein